MTAPLGDLGLPRVSCPTPVCETCQQGLDCGCHLPPKELGAGTATHYTSGSSATTRVGNTQVPDKLYVTDKIHCTDKTKAGNKKASGTEIGTRNFTINGQVSINERYDEASAHCKEARSRSNACGHSECRTELVTNTPPPGGVPCACQ